MENNLSLNNICPHKDTKGLLQTCSQDTTKPRILQVVFLREFLWISIGRWGEYIVRMNMDHYL